MTSTTDRTGEPFSRSRFEALVKRRFFYTESFEIYRTSPNFKGDNRGLYDYGPPGCALQANIVNEWRNHFIIEENMLEVECTVLTPEPVLKTSGHVAKFADWMCKDAVNGEHLRADHLVESVLTSRLAKARDASPADQRHNPGKLDNATVKEYEDVLAKIDNYGGPELGQLIRKFDIQTAQGQFLNFRKLLEFNQNSIPFASASIGKSYRNEISPRSGLIRVREFLMAEIEHFVDPATSKSHERFPEVASLSLPLLDRATQLSGATVVTTTSLREAVKSKTVDNETLGYFMGRIYLFLVKIGVDKSKIRFRQHLVNEMAHYATDCWDAELLTSYGWIECVGCADRSAYDLSVHSRQTGAALVVKEPLAEPIEVEKWQATLDKKLLGPRFKKDAKKIEAAVASLDQDVLADLAAQLVDKKVISVATEELADGRTAVELSEDICSIKKVKLVEKMREYTPNVIEPSFGIGRILYCLLEQAYWHRLDDIARGVLSLPILVAPVKVLIVPLSNHPSFQPLVRRLADRLTGWRIPNNVDSSSTFIGKRYSRNDEFGTPLGITVDFQTVDDASITLRERDSMVQVRSSEEAIFQAVRSLVGGKETWEQVSKRLPPFLGQIQDN